MNESLPSKTCLYVAAGRALGARDPDPAVRNPDYLAERLLGPLERELVAEQACVQALDQDYSEALKNREAIGSALMMQVRLVLSKSDWQMPTKWRNATHDPRGRLRYSSLSVDGPPREYAGF